MIIVYETNTGSTERYAKMLSEKLGVPAIKMTEQVNPNEDVIFMSWVMAGTLQNYAKAKELYSNIKAVCAVGMFSDEGKKAELIEKNAITEEFFILPGAFNVNKLTGLYKMMMGMAMKMIKGKLKESNDPKAKEMLEKFDEGFDMVDESNLEKVIEYLK